MKNEQIKKTKKIALRIFAGALVSVMTVSMMLSSSVTPKVHASNANVQKYEEEIANLEQKQKELQQQINNIDNEAAQTLAEKQYYDSLVTTVQAKITASEALIAELDSEIEATEKAIEEHEASIATTISRIREQMAVSQKSGNSSYLDVLMGAEGIGEFLSRYERVNLMIDYEKKNLDSFKKEKEELTEAKKSLEASKALQQKTIDALETDKQNSEYWSSQSEQYLKNLENDKAAYQSEYEKAKAQEAALDSELSALLAQIQAQNSSPVVASGDGWLWPLPAGGYISCQFGGTDPNGAPHYAVDTAIPGGTPIYAVNDGYVVRAEWHYSYGNYIVLDHGNGISTLYAHCSGLAVGAGQTVSKGQVIGYVGTTGFSTGTHLHLEFRNGGQKVNPMSYVTPY